MRKSLLLAVVVAAVTIVSAGSAAAADVFERLTAERLIGILQAAGATQIERKNLEGEADAEVITFHDGTGFEIFTLVDCTADGCSELQMSVFFEKDDSVTLSAINSYNGTYLHAQAAQMKSGNVGLFRIFLPVGGVTEGNLRANMQMFVEAPALFDKHVHSQVTASVDAKGKATPVAAASEATLKLGGARALGAKAGWIDPTKALGDKAYRKLTR